MNEKLLDRVRKLLRLAEGTSNPNEAAAAAAAAQKIITEHNLGIVSLDEAEAVAEELDDGPIRAMFFNGYGDAANEVFRTRRPLWAGQLAGSIAKVNGCSVYWTRDHNKKWHVAWVGRKADTATSVYLWRYLCRQVNEITAKQTQGRGRDYAASFRQGMVYTLGARLTAAHDEAKRGAQQQAFAHGGENAIVKINERLAKLDERKRQLDSYVEATTTLKSTRAAVVSNIHAHAAGRIAGSKVNLATGRPLPATSSAGKEIGS